MKKTIITIIALLLTAQVAFAADPKPSDGISGNVSAFMSESFQTDLATGAATMSIPITVPPGRKNMQPQLALSYSSNNSDGICGVGWAIPSNLIQRPTKEGVPKYDNNTDTFIFASPGSNAELVYIGNNLYSPKIEGAFMKYTFNGATWLILDKAGTRYTFGSNSASRLENGSNIFGWYLDKVEDVYGNYLTYIYDKPTDGQIYLKEIQYTGSNGPETLLPDKSIVFNYVDRLDKQYSYRSGWHIITSKLLKSIEVNFNGSRVWLYDLDYITSPDTTRSLLRTITVYDKDGNSLPPKTFTYSRLEP